MYGYSLKCVHPLVYTMGVELTATNLRKICLKYSTGLYTANRSRSFIRVQNFACLPRQPVPNWLALYAAMRSASTRNRLSNRTRFL